MRDNEELKKPAMCVAHIKCTTQERAYTSPQRLC